MAFNSLTMRISQIVLFFFIYLSSLSAQSTIDYYVYSEIGLSTQKFKTNISGLLDNDFGSNSPRVEYSRPSVTYNVGIQLDKRLSSYLKLSSSIDIGKIGHRDRIQTINFPGPVVSAYNRYHSRISISIKAFLFSIPDENIKKRKKSKPSMFLQLRSINSFAFAEEYRVNNKNELNELFERRIHLSGYEIGLGVQKDRLEFSWKFSSYFNNLFKLPSVIKHTYFAHTVRLSYRLNKKESVAKRKKN